MAAPPAPAGPPPAASAPQHPPAGPPPDEREADGSQEGAHSIAVDAQQDLHKLATALAHAGANPQAVAQLMHMAGIVGQIVKVLGEGPNLPNATAAGPGPAGPPVAPPPGAGPAGPPPGAGPAGPPQPAPPPPAHQALQHATQALHAMARDAAKQRAGQ